MFKNEYYQRQVTVRDKYICKLILFKYLYKIFFNAIKISVKLLTSAKTVRRIPNNSIYFEISVTNT